MKIVRSEFPNHPPPRLSPLPLHLPIINFTGKHVCWSLLFKNINFEEHQRTAAAKSIYYTHVLLSLDAVTYYISYNIQQLCVCSFGLCCLLPIISVRILCEFAMLPDVYILLSKKRCTLLPDGTDVHIGQHIHEKD